MQGRHQVLQVLKGAQHGVDLVVVRGVVAVGGVGFENGGQVDQADPQLLQVGDGLPDALQVAAEIAVVFDLSPIPGLDARPRGAFAPEAVRENLVAHLAQGPGRQGPGRVDIGKGEGVDAKGGLPKGFGLLDALLVQVAGLPTFLQFKQVALAGVIRGEVRLVPVVQGA